MSGYCCWEGPSASWAHLLQIKRNNFAFCFVQTEGLVGVDCVAEHRSMLILGLGQSVASDWELAEPVEDRQERSAGDFWRRAVNERHWDGNLG